MKIQINEIKRMQLLAGIITEVLDQDLVDTLAKEVEEKFGKNYFLTNHLVNTAKFREFNQWEDEKIKQYGYKAKLALTQISVNQRDAALPQIEDIMVAAIPTLGWKKGKFSKDTPEYKKMEADIHDKLEMEKGSGLDNLNVLDNYYGSGIMGELIKKHFKNK
jgi:predicted ATP-binding protein involved in virulence